METELERVVAVLHDVVEDCPGWSFERLRAEGIPDSAIEALIRVTHLPEEKDDYDAFVDRAAANPISRRVKIADIEDNMDLRRLSEITDRTVVRLRKYLRAWRRLHALS
jgi:hypothetical protein